MLLKKLTLSHDEKKGNWALKEDGKDRALRRFDTKADALKRGVLEGALGKDGGSVKIQRKDGVYQEERTYPRSADPRSSKG
ncbi:DUF2188 domain-containing protein [Phyllobacterium sp. LjRoot231]|uniref:DUF2188 domain-containing protein n=1 Tax=Phyllobacterium sp. LjRoot231 TaxID=3342289 RepID=UPI003ECCFAB5